MIRVVWPSLFVTYFIFIRAELKTNKTLRLLLFMEENQKYALAKIKHQTGMATNNKAQKKCFYRV
jgi:hypothetical protein